MRLLVPVVVPVFVVVDGETMRAALLVHSRIQGAQCHFSRGKVHLFLDFVGLIDLNWCRGVDLCLLCNGWLDG
jgi:hypothetical protein